MLFRKFFRRLNRRGVRASIVRQQIVRRKRAALRPMFELLESRKLMANISWIAAGGGSWSTAANWSSGTVPTAADDVTIPDLVGDQNITITTTASVNSITSQEDVTLSPGGALTVASSAAFDSGLILNTTGTFTANGVTTLGDVSTWTQGTIAGTGVITNNGTLQINATSGVSLAGNLVNAGTITHSGAIAVGVTGTFVNQATGIYTITANTGGLNVSGGPASLIHNQGTIRRSAGTGAFNFNASITGTPTVRNTGTVEIQTGTATWQGAANVIHAGTWDLSSGTSLTFSNGAQTFGDGSQIIGLGTANFGSGTMNFENTTISAAVSHAGRHMVRRKRKDRHTDWHEQCFVYRDNLWCRYGRESRHIQFTWDDFRHDLRQFHQ